MANDSYVQIPLDGSGKKVQNLQITVRVLNSDGSVTDESHYVQKVQLVDDQGAPVDLAGQLAAMKATLSELRKHLAALMQVTLYFNNSKDDHRAWMDLVDSPIVDDT